MTDKQPLDISTGKVYYDRYDKKYVFVTDYTLWTVDYYHLNEPEIICTVKYDFAEEQWDEV